MISFLLFHQASLAAKYEFQYINIDLLINVALVDCYYEIDVSVLLKSAIKQLGFLEDYVWLPTSTNSSLVLEQL